MVDTTELAIALKLLDALKAYDLTPSKVGCIVDTTVKKNGVDEVLAKEYSIRIGIRSEDVAKQFTAFIDDFNSRCKPYGIGTLRSNKAKVFSCGVEVTDVLPGLDKMIAAKSLGISM
jgi:hypothetical protein